MTIKDIYEKYKIPPNLAEHMLRVTKVAAFVCAHWKDQKVDVELVKKGALLHDLGNIVKFKFEHLPDLIAPEEQEYWKTIQNSFIEKYGSEANEATRRMVEEIGIRDEALEEILRGGWESPSKSWERRIVLYADSRVGPFGVVSLKERIEDLKDRYGWQTVKKYIDVAQERERKIQENLTAPVSEITDKSVARKDKELLNTEI